MVSNRLAALALALCLTLLLCGPLKLSEQKDTEISEARACLALIDEKTYFTAYATDDKRQGIRPASDEEMQSICPEPLCEKIRPVLAKDFVEQVMKWPHLSIHQKILFDLSADLGTGNQVVVAWTPSETFFHLTLAKAHVTYQGRPCGTWSVHPKSDNVVRAML